MVQHILNDVDPGVLKTTLVNFFIYGNDASPSRQPPQPRRSKERAQKANTRKNTKKQRFPFGKRCFSSLPRKGEGFRVRVRRGARHRRRWRKPRTASSKKHRLPDGETVLLHARRCYDPLPDVCAGAVTSVRVTPLEKVRLLRMAEKSLDMLR